MSYLVLARRFRPQAFESVIGQDHITKALANAILRNRVPHAFLFTGPRGVGKTTTARILARALNCTGRKEISSEQVKLELDGRPLVEPCGECANCLEITKGSSIAVQEIDGASHNSVENVRDLIDSLRSLPPPGSKYKIYIIDEVHMLSTSAFNALLKSLEEPPPNTIFIFATTEPHKIPETVISRCQRHDFRRIPSSTIAESLQMIAAEEAVEVEEGVVEFIALKAQGGMRDAQSMFDRLIAFSAEKIELANAHQLFGVVDARFFFRLSEAVFAQDVPRGLSLLEEAFNQSIDIRAFVADFITHFRNLLLVGLTKTTDNSGSRAGLRKAVELSAADFLSIEGQVANMSSFDLQRIFAIAEEIADTALASNFPRYVLEAGVARMATLSSLRPLAKVLADLDRLSSNTPVTQAASIPSNNSDHRRDSKFVSEPPIVSPTSVSSSNRQESKNQVEEVSGGTSQDGGFNPSWQDFITHVRTARSEVVLAELLRRVSPKVFEWVDGQGRLQIQGGEYYIKSFKDPQSNQSLKNCLHSYSGCANWDIRFLEQKGDLSPGSIAAQEAKDKQKQTAQVRVEAKSDPVVKAVLELFEGSSIERISVTKPG